jgi:phosphoglycerate dehydrogenase-like enzyme
VHIVSDANLREHHQERLKEAFPEHHFMFVESMDQLSKEQKEKVEVLLTYGRHLTDQLFDQMPQLKWIQALTAGLEKMPLKSLHERGILLTNVRGLHAIQMAEYTISMMINLVRRTFQFYELQKEKRWDPTVRLDEAYGKTVGILGLGAIGQEIAKRAKAFGLKVIGLRKHPAPCPPYVDRLLSSGEEDILFSESDFVVVLLPLTPETRNFIGAQQLAKMKEDAYLINIARGAVLDEAALLDAVRQGQIGGAVLDVFVEEPLPEDHPFWTEKKIIITPHVSGRSPRYMQRAMDIFVENLTHYPDLSKMKNVIDPTRGY